MTEAEAWREIARRIVERKAMGSGLYHEAWKMWTDGNVPRFVLASMHRRVDAHMRSGQSYALPGKQIDEARILAALWMALEAEEEGAHDSLR